MSPPDPQDDVVLEKLSALSLCGCEAVGVLRGLIMLNQVPADAMPLVTAVLARFDAVVEEYGKALIKGKT